VTDRSPEALSLFRHSTAHLLAAAVTNLFPGTQCGIGPATDEGFFYDFVVPRPFVPEDLETIEKKMQELASQDLVYERQMWPREEAKTFFAGRGEPLKVQLIEEKTEGQRDVSPLHDQGQGHVHRLRVGHVLSTERSRRSSCPAHRTRTGRRRAKSADAARLRHTFPSEKTPLT
jgi:threonyl-tRNA synthetase